MWPEFIAGIAVALLLLSLLAVLRDRGRLHRRCQSYGLEVETLRYRLAETERALDRLNMRLAAMTEAAKQRVLCERQHELLVRSLISAAAPAVHLRIYDDRETRDYADGLLRALQAGGAKVTTERIHSSEAEGARFGDMITLRGTENSRHILGACRAAGIPLRTQYSEEHLPAPAAPPAVASGGPDAMITLNQRISVEGRVALFLANPTTQLGLD